MANEVTTAPSFSTMLTAKLEDNNAALPADFNKARFVQNALALLNDHPELAKYGRDQLIAGLMKGAILGLDFYNKEAYLIPYGTQLNYQVDYKGKKKLAKKYSIRPILDIDAKIVREGDEFQERIIEGKTTFDFTPKPFSTAPVVGAFAYVIYKDGGMLLDTMSKDDLEKTHKHSKAQNSMAWKDFTTEMYRKTVLHRLCKHIELEFENPQQRELFTEDVAIETDTREDVKNEIAMEANVIDFDAVESEATVIEGA